MPIYRYHAHAHTPSLMQLIGSEQFVVVVPEAVIKGLDALKHGTLRVNKGARDAIRYLEEVRRPLPISSA